jgi:glycosyltransferase involved in cell wall biosynthesis
MVTLANEFVERGFGVDLVLAKAHGPYLADVHPSIRVVDLDSKRLIFSLISLVKYLKKEKPEVMLSALSTANIIAVVAKLISRLSFRLVISERAVSSVALKDNNLIRSKFLPLLMRLTYRKADAVIAVAQGVADDLVENYNLQREKISVVYNPVVTQKLIQLSNEEFRHEWFGDHAIPVILSVGRLTSQKNFSLLIEAFSILLETQDARLVILGHGELQKDLEALASSLKINDKVRFPGFVDNPFMWFRNASLFVLSSNYEGLPGTLIQAMACGTPVVSTDCPSGPSEILEKGRWGKLVPVGDVLAMSRALADTLIEKDHPAVELRAQFFDVDNGVDGYQIVLGLSSDTV